MKKQDLLFIFYYLFISIIVIFVFNIIGLSEYESLRTNLYEKPFDLCRVITNHTYKDIYYGGFRNYLWGIAFYILMGIGVFAFAFPISYFIDKHLLKGYFFEIKDGNNYKYGFKDKFRFILIIPLSPFIYTLLIFLILSIYYGDIYNCSNIINWVESSY